jgi:uncharacterized Zn-binding protein involved in type VI secretion
MGRAVTRIGDADIPHCSAANRAEGSPNVFVNGRALSRQGDLNTVHDEPSGSDCSPHAAPIETGSTTVFVNGKGCGRIGDLITGCTAVSEGSPNVFAGG